MGSAGFPKILQSRCFAYDASTTYNYVKVSYNGTGQFGFGIGTASSPGATITWQNVTANSQTTLTNPNYALFYRCAGNIASELTMIKVEYS